MSRREVTEMSYLTHSHSFTTAEEIHVLRLMSCVELRTPMRLSRVYQQFTKEISLVTDVFQHYTFGVTLLQ